MDKAEDSMIRTQHEMSRHFRAGGTTYDTYCTRCCVQFPCPSYLQAQQQLAALLTDAHN